MSLSSGAWFTELSIAPKIFWKNRNGWDALEISINFDNSTIQGRCPACSHQKTALRAHAIKFAISASDIDSSREGFCDPEDAMTRCVAYLHRDLAIPA
jgi:hypothetical protein